MTSPRWTLGELTAIVRGELRGAAETNVERVVIDSRDDVRGALFIALKGEKFDGHQFVTEVAQSGASAAIVEHRVSSAAIPQIVVTSGLEALQELARVRRRRFSGPVVAITGSSGKTTTRKLVASILSQSRATHQPVRNFNNHVGVPLTLLALGDEHAALVLELGCSDFGEIARLTDISDPDYGLVTNVGPAHLEKLGDLHGVARAKGELWRTMRPDAHAVINVDDPLIAAMTTAPQNRISFGSLPDVDVRLNSRRFLGLRGQELTFLLRGEELKATLRLLGLHNARNALAAAALALEVGSTALDIAQGLAGVPPEPGRLGITAGPEGSLILDDTYNANPASMRAALDTALEIAGKGKVIAVLGDMLELGMNAERAHLDLGAYFADHGGAELITLGAGGRLIGRGAKQAGLKETDCSEARDHEHAAKLATVFASRGAIILVKGSRGMKMERVVASLRGGGGADAV